MGQALTVVIPALNEASVLPRLLAALRAQTRAPEAIVVADADSEDGTADIARRAGCVVVAGGTPPVGRNAGAAVAETGTILFLDADVVPPPDFIERAMAQFDDRALTCATCSIESLEPGLLGRVIMPVASAYLRAVSRVSPHATGACILVRADAHRAIGGFDELAVLAEDHDYARRISKVGRFAVLTGLTIPVSVRRWRDENMALLTAKTVWCEVHVLAGRPIHSAPFEYVFGRHAEADRRYRERRSRFLREVAARAERAHRR